MCERAIQPRNSQFLSQIIPTKITLEELIQEKFEIGKFPLTITGLIKVSSIIISVTGLALYVAQPFCAPSLNKSSFLFPLSVGSCSFLQFVFYFIFSSGMAARNTEKWIKIDIIVTLLLGISAILFSVLTTVWCKTENLLENVPGYLGITGGVLGILGCASLFLMYRFVELPQENSNKRNFDPRKSMQV